MYRNRVHSMFSYFAPDELTADSDKTNMSSIEFNSLSECLEKYIQGDELKEVKKILFGRADEYVFGIETRSCYRE